MSRSLDREKVPAYTLVVLAIDRGVPQQTGTATLNITVGDVNDVPPVFSPSTVSVDVNETSTGVLYRMNAKDEDEDHQLLYEIVWAESSASDPLQNPIGLSKRQVRVGLVVFIDVTQTKYFQRKLNAHCGWLEREREGEREGDRE